MTYFLINFDYEEEVLEFKTSQLLINHLDNPETKSKSYTDASIIIQGERLVLKSQLAIINKEIAKKKKAKKKTPAKKKSTKKKPVKKKGKKK